MLLLIPTFVNCKTFQISETDRKRIRTPRYKIPEGWLDMPPTSLTIITDTFVAFKTPLDQKYNNRVPVKKRFNTEMLFSTISNMKVIM